MLPLACPVAMKTDTSLMESGGADAVLDARECR
jgi:hypothetical protein